MTTPTHQQTRTTWRVIAAAAMPVGVFLLVLVALTVSGDSTGPQMFANDVFAGLGTVFGTVLAGTLANARGIGLFILLVVPNLALGVSDAGLLARVVVFVVWLPIALGINWVARQGYSALTGWLFEDRWARRSEIRRRRLPTCS